MPQSARTMIDATLSERNFQNMVIEAAHYFGWIVYHVPDSRRVTASGYLDLSIIHPVKHRFLVREIKTEKGRLRSDQLMWLEAMQASGIDAGVWRPSDWETIMETLSA